MAGGRAICDGNGRARTETNPGPFVEVINGFLVIKDQSGTVINEFLVIKRQFLLYGRDKYVVVRNFCSVLSNFG
jgi:hypothetical protein